MDQGLTIKGIADKVGFTPGGVKYWLGKHGLTIEVGLKAHKCSECEETDPTQFYGTRKGMCKKCAKLDTARRIKLHKTETVRMFGGKCERCGYSKCVAALEFHHTDPTQKDPSFRTMRNWSVKPEKLAELEKCELLCSNCHREAHWMQYELI